MKRFLAMGAAAALLVFPSLAFSAPGGEGNNTDCNGRGNPSSPCVPTAGNGGSSTVTNNVRNNIRASARASSRASALGVGVGIGQGGRGGSAAANATGGQASASGGSATVNVSGAGGGTSGYYEARERLRVPDVSAPAIWSNNPCVVALSGGVAVAGFGASIGAGIEDRDCTRRANAQHLQAMGESAAAREVMCGNSEVRAAFVRVGRPCAEDVARPQAAAAPAPAPVVATPVSAPARQVPGWCASYTAAERARMSVCR